MLNKDEALMAIQYFYKDFENLLVGNPLPFVKSYDKDTQIQFNELCFDGELKHIFYGNITYAMDSNDSVAITDRISLAASRNFDGTSVMVVLDIHKFFDATPVLANCFQGTTKGVFVSQIVLQENSYVSFDGYLFALTLKKP